jgi:hypothetical protein
MLISFDPFKVCNFHQSINPFKSNQIKILFIRNISKNIWEQQFEKGLKSLLWLENLLSIIYDYLL